MISLSSNFINFQLLRQRVMNFISKGDCEFEGEMINNGAEKSLSVLDVYLRYCVLTNTSPGVKPSTQKILGIGNWIQLA